MSQISLLTANSSIASLFTYRLHEHASAPLRLQPGAIDGDEWHDEPTLLVMLDRSMNQVEKVALHSSARRIKAIFHYGMVQPQGVSSDSLAYLSILRGGDLLIATSGYWAYHLHALVESNDGERFSDSYVS